jgi:CheY-like chemotaxis protein
MLRCVSPGAALCGKGKKATMAYRLLILPGNNQALRELASEFSSDVDVQVMDSANDALWEIRHSAPSAIVADTDLPGMSGLDLAEIVPNFGVGTQIVLWSREPDAQAEKQAALHGVQHFLSGPQSTDQLKTTVYNAMRQRPPAEEAAAVAEMPPQPSAPATPARPHGEAASAAPRTPPEPAPAPPAEPARVAPRAAAPAPPSEPRRAPPAEPAPVRRPSRRRPEGSFVLTAEHVQPIKSRMNELLQEVGAECIILTDRNGMVLSEVGSSGGIPTMILLPMLSTSFSAAGQISQMLREPESNALYVQEGQHYDLYCFDLLQSFMLVLIFDKRMSRSKIGTVWVYAKRAIRDIQAHLS